jgi:hypothetical protein
LDHFFQLLFDVGVFVFKLLLGILVGIKGGFTDSTKKTNAAYSHNIVFNQTAGKLDYGMLWDS